jgi:hypothetical protein
MVDDVTADLFAKLMIECLGMSNLSLLVAATVGAIIIQSLARRCPKLRRRSQSAFKKRHVPLASSFLHVEETTERQRCCMVQTSSAIPGIAVRSVASGILFMAFFGTLWSDIGIGALHGWGWPWLLIVSVMIGIGLLIGGISLLLASRRLSNQVAEADIRRWRRTEFWFNMTFATEGLFIVVAGGICNALNRFDVFFPIMALIVGVHFFPLAALFQVKIYYLVGALFCLLAFITLLVVPESVKLGSQQITAQWVVLGFGAAMILWAVGLGLWLLGKKLLDLSEPTGAQKN